MGFEQEAYEAECAAIARALETAARRRKKLGHLTIFTDVQAAIWRVTSDDSGPGQKYAIAARKHIAELRCKEPEISIEIRWCHSHCEIEGNEKADEWAKPAADEPDSLAWSGLATKTATGASICLHVPPRTSNASSLKRSGRMPAGGPRRSSSGPRTASTCPATGNSRARLWLAPT